jgi:ankyrin repeat protein
MSFGWDAVSENASFQNVLVDATDRGDEEEVARLLKSGQNPDSKGEFGVTSLMRAALRGHALIAEMLVKAGAYVNATDVGGEAPLHLAARNGNAKMVQMLLYYDAEIDAVDNQQWTPLMRSIASRNVETTKILVEKGANLNATDNIGNSALVHAVIAGKSEVVKIILNSDRFNVIPKEQKVASIRVAEKSGNKDISKMLSDAQEYFKNKEIVDNNKTDSIDSVAGKPVSLKYENTKNNFVVSGSFEVGFDKTVKQSPFVAPSKKIEKTVSEKTHSSDSVFSGFDVEDSSISQAEVEKPIADEDDGFNPSYDRKKGQILPVPIVPDDVLKKSIPVDITKKSDGFSGDSAEVANTKKTDLDKQEKLPLLLPSDQLNMVGGVPVVDSSSDKALPWLGDSAGESADKEIEPVALSDASSETPKKDVDSLKDEPFSSKQELPEAPFVYETNVVDETKNESLETFSFADSESDVSQGVLPLKSEKKIKELDKVSGHKRKELLPIPIVSDELLKNTVAKQYKAPSIEKSEKLLYEVLGSTKLGDVQNKKEDTQQNTGSLGNKNIEKQEVARPAWMNKFLYVFSNPAKVVKDDSSLVKNSNNVPFDDESNKNAEQRQVVPEIPQESFVLPVDVIELPPPPPVLQESEVSEVKEKTITNNSGLFSAPNNSEEVSADSLAEQKVVFSESPKEPSDLPLPPIEKELVEEKQILSTPKDVFSLPIEPLEERKTEEGLPWLTNSSDTSSKPSTTVSDKSEFVYSDPILQPQSNFNPENSYSNSYKNVNKKYAETGEVSEAILVRKDNIEPNFASFEEPVDEGIWLEVSPFADNQSADDYADRMFRYDEELSKLKVKFWGGNSSVGNQIKIKVGPIDGYKKADILCNSVKAGGLTCSVTGNPVEKMPVSDKMQKNLYTPKVKKLQKSPDVGAVPYWVNLGAFSDGYKAEYYWAFLQEDNSQITNGLNYKIEKSGANSVKLKVGPFSEKYIADDTCSLMRTRNIACLVIK